MNKFLKFLERRGRRSVILDRQSSEPYLTRYYLFLKDRKRFPFNIFLHNFHKGDPDDLHDHPWCWATFIVRGGYWEHTPEGKFWRGPGTFRVARSTARHRIELEPGVDVWTLFMVGPKIREWGFYPDGKWIPWHQYIAQKSHNAQTAGEHPNEVVSG